MVLVFLGSCGAIKPILYMHGILASNTEAGSLLGWINDVSRTLNSHFFIVRMMLMMMMMVVVVLSLIFFIDFFKGSTFVGSGWSFGFFIPVTTANDLRL